MRVIVPRFEIRDFVKEAILYGKFYGGETYAGSCDDDYLFSIALSNNVVTVTLHYEFWFFGNRVFTAKIELPKEKCSFYKKCVERARRGGVRLDTGDADDLISVLFILTSCEEFQVEPDERRNEFVKVYELLGLRGFIEYLLKHATIDNLDGVHIGLILMDAVDLFKKYIRDNNSDDN